MAHARRQVSRAHNRAKFWWLDRRPNAHGVQRLYHRARDFHRWLVRSLGLGTLFAGIPHRSPGGHWSRARVCARLGSHRSGQNHNPHSGCSAFGGGRHRFNRICSSFAGFCQPKHADGHRSQCRAVRSPNPLCRSSPHPVGTPCWRSIRPLRVHCVPSVITRSPMDISSTIIHPTTNAIYAVRSFFSNVNSIGTWNGTITRPPRMSFDISPLKLKRKGSPPPPPPEPAPSITE